jgi:hypothetical protein
LIHFSLKHVDYLGLYIMNFFRGPEGLKKNLQNADPIQLECRLRACDPICKGVQLPKLYVS